jgi:large subunit ribosomal protein L30e
MIEVRTSLKSNKAILGSDEILKSLKQGNIRKVLVSSNSKEDLKRDLEYYKSISNFEIVSVKYNSEELGIICKKPFTVSIIGFLKE